MTLLAIVLMAMTAGALSAQNHQDPPSDSLLRRIADLDARYIERRRAVDSIRRAKTRPAPDVEVRHGPLRIRTTRALEPRVRAAAKAVTAVLDRRGDTTAAARIALRTPMIVPDSTRALFGVEPVIAILPDTSASGAAGRAAVPFTAGVAGLTERLTTIVEQFALDGADSALTAWIMIGRVPLRDATADELADAYVELATFESTALAQCRAGATERCLDVLGLDSVPGRRLDRWYAPGEYRAMMHQVAPSHEDSAAVDAWLRCRRTGEQTACVRAARAIPESRILVPVSPAVRYLFFEEVLRTGGPGAYDRLRAARGAIRERLAVAAGAPLDHVVWRWLGRITAGRRQEMRVGPTVTIASLGWCALLVGFVLVRRRSWA